jgi:N-acetylneuraminic acid mutarotase
MQVPRRLLGTTVLNGKIYAFGGSREEPNWYINDVESFDPVQNTWSTLKSLPVTGECSAATVGQFIYIFVCGKGVF